MRRAAGGQQQAGRARSCEFGGGSAGKVGVRGEEGGKVRRAGATEREAREGCRSVCCSVLVLQFLGWLVGGFAGWRVRVGWVVDGFVVGCVRLFCAWLPPLVGQVVGLFGWSIGWFVLLVPSSIRWVLGGVGLVGLVGWLVGWLVDWLIG